MSQPTHTTVASSAREVRQRGLYAREGAAARRGARQATTRSPRVGPGLGVRAHHQYAREPGLQSLELAVQDRATRDEQAALVLAPEPARLTARDYRRGDPGGGGRSSQRLAHPGGRLERGHLVLERAD